MIHISNQFSECFCYTPAHALKLLSSLPALDN